LKIETKRRDARMTTENFERAKEIQKRIHELKTAYGWLGDVESKIVSIIATGCSMNDRVRLSPDSRKVLKQMVDDEIDKLQSEFKKL
jgi:hypothetical protein